jgi:hypothetical protein
MTAMQTKLRRKQGRRSNGPPFVQLFKYMLKSPAWLGLSCNARAAYIQLALRYDGCNNGMLALSARTLGHELQCDKATAARALIELENAGFIQTTKIGAFARKRQASEYRLTTLRCDATGELPSKAFMRLIPVPPRQRRRDPRPTKRKPWEIEGVSRRTWYRRKAAFGALDGTVPQAHLTSAIGAFNPVPVPKSAIQAHQRAYKQCHGAPHRRTHATLIESNHGETSSGNVVPRPAVAPSALPWATPTLIEITDPEVVAAIRCAAGPDPKCGRPALRVIPGKAASPARKSTRA